jgi:hypothetical protein
LLAGDYFAMASLAGLFRIIRFAFGGVVGRLTGMLSGFVARAPEAFGAPGAPGEITIDAESGFAAVCAVATVSNSRALDAIVAKIAVDVMARDFIVSSGWTAHSIR